MRDLISHTPTARRKARPMSLIRPALLSIVTILCLSLFAFGQQPDRGFRAANTYAASGLDAVNMADGNLIMSIPVASLPSGRGGSPGYSVHLQYNSKLWESNEAIQDHGIPTENGVTKYSVTRLALSDSGGWRLVTDYRLKVTDRLAFEMPDPCWLGDPIEHLKFRWKVEMEMPDGSITALYPRIWNEGNPLMSDDGYAAIDTNGKYYQVHQTTNPANGSCMINSSEHQLTASGMTYISMDGSRLRLFIPYQSPNWKLYFPDGRMVENMPPDNPSVFQRITDRNNNAVEHRAEGICDQVGRCIVTTTDSNGQMTVTVKGVRGEPLSTRIEWGRKWLQKTYRITTAQNAPNFLLFETLYTNLWSVRKIVFPTQLGQQEMIFDYFGTDHAPDEGVETEEWGELKSVMLPTGAKTLFQYGQSSDTAADILNRSTVKKSLVYTDQYPGESPVERTDTWLYNPSRWGSEVTGSDGAFSTEGKHYNMNSAWWNNGLVYVSSNPDNLVERVWAPNVPFTISSNGPVSSIVGAGSANAYVKTELTTLRSLDGSVSASSPTAIKDFRYDKNGNVLEIKEYDFVTYGSVNRNGGGVTGLPPLTLKRRTVNTYYNQTADAENPTSDQNSYSDPSSPRLKNVIKSTEIQDGSGTPVSRSEFFYDDPRNKGNLVETRLWDSTKGQYSSPLTGTNSISTRAAYDDYGNAVETTDANGVKTKFTFGDVAGPNGNVTGLYPTKTELASNYEAVTRTSAAVYDFYTGLVTTAADVDNNLSAITEYDPLGRPIKVKSAAGTALESWTRTEYDDIARRVIVRSDIETVGDGRRVAAQFFDQLGRLRLSKTLEDATTQSAVNETDGIKVETRYGYIDPTPSDPNDPANTLGRYTLMSNPFRAAYASQATPESTMGWTRSKGWNHGHRQEIETFSGASLPAPWGGNVASTGVVKTESDENATTVTDQAAKQKRSIADALGQLIRVDEPSNDGVLGTVAAPRQPTYYSYNATGQLVHVRQDIQNRFFMYDSLGRLLRVRQPEQMINPELNTGGNPENNSWTAGFSYDNNGNMLTATDANNVTSTTAYDALRRQLTRTYTDPTPEVRFDYDDPDVPFSHGKLTGVSSTISESRFLAYDEHGRLRASEQLTDGRTYPSGYKYDLSGVLTEQTYPSKRVVKNFTEVDGDLAAISSRIENGPFKNYATNFAYTASRAIKHLQLGNGLWESAQLNSRNQVTELKLGNSPTDGSLWRLNYHYGELDSDGNVDVTKNTGNVARQTIGSSGLASPFVQTYRYDSLWRIKDAGERNNGNLTWSQSFEYDRYGNRTSLSQNVGGQMLPVNNLTLPQIDAYTNRYQDGQGYSYDKVGNLIEDPYGREFVFNGDNKQTAVKNSAHVPIGEYFYDGNGNRIKKVTPTETTVFVYDGLGKLIEELSTATPPQNPTVNYTATDPLGSPRVLTNKQGQIVSRRDFMPFGEELTPDATYRTGNLKYGAADTVRQKFTGYQRDPETGLDFAEARYYQNNHGRFTAVDPLLASGKSADPQTFNRYVYTMNRPLVLTDSTGLQAGQTQDSQVEQDTVSVSKRWFIKNDFGSADVSAEVKAVLDAAATKMASNLYNAMIAVHSINENPGEKVTVTILGGVAIEADAVGGKKKAAQVSGSAELKGSVTTEYASADPVIRELRSSNDVIQTNVTKSLATAEIPIPVETGPPSMVKAGEAGASNGSSMASSLALAARRIANEEAQRRYTENFYPDRMIPKEFLFRHY